MSTRSTCISTSTRWTPGAGRANRYAAAGGPSLATLLAAVDLVFDRFDVRAAALTAYDPEADVDGRAGAAGLQLLARVMERVLRT